MAAWSDWLPDVGIDVPGCPSFTIEWAVRRTVIDFLERTHWIQRTVSPITVTAGAGERVFASPVVESGETVLRIIGAWLDGTPIEVCAPADVEGDLPDWKTATGTPECIVQEAPGAYWVVPAPEADMTNALRLKVAIGLLDSATSCDDLLATVWKDAIAAGAKARLHLMPNARWSNPQQALIQEKKYTDAVRGAILHAMRTPAHRPLQTKPYYF